MTDHENDTGHVEFHEMELDDRILKALAKLGWEKPTLIQERAIPLLLNRKDVLMRARTGSGKTGAFTIPIIQNILKQKQVTCEKAVKALILAPSRELCHQIHSHIQQLTTKCSREVQCIDISPQTGIEVQRSLLIEHPDILIATPARALNHLQANTFSLKDSLEMLVIDEADLMFSYGYEADVKDVLEYLPLIYQAILASATLSEDVISLKKLMLHNAVTLKLQEPVLAPVSQLVHYVIYAEEDNKAAILYVLLKLSLVHGKTIVFVNTVDKCYKLKLFLEQFAIRTCVLNSELPASVRCHSVIQFNEGTYDIIIATDEKTLEDHGKSSAKSEGKRKKDKESGIVRGIDFQFVCNVVNFDFPLDVTSYIHRAGRAARGTNQGTALSFVSVHEKATMDEVEKHLRIGLSEKENIFKTYQYNLEEMEGFKYRAKDAWKAVTRIAVREARLKEIKQEILNSEKLKGYFLENPRDLKSLRHDKALHTVKLQPHLADVPSYLIPKSLKRVAIISKSKEHKRRKQYIFCGEHKYNKAKQENPLLSMQFLGFNKTNSSKL